MIPTIHFGSSLGLSVRPASSFSLNKGSEFLSFGMDSRRPPNKRPPARKKSYGSDGTDEAGIPLPGGYTEDDILPGRGKGVSQHKGNRRFRKIIRRYCNPYMKAQTNQERRRIVDIVLQEVHSKGRFLEPSDDPNTNWIILTEKKIREKVSQALRYQQRIQASGSEGDNRSASSSVTAEDEMISPDTSENPSERDNLGLQLLGPPTEYEEEEAMQSLDQWEGAPIASTSTQAPLVSDQEILASIGAHHLFGQLPHAEAAELDPQDEVEDLL